MTDLYGNDIEDGCHVRLTCGEKVMVVECAGRHNTTGEQEVFCHWEEGGAIHEGRFPALSLEVVSSVDELRKDYER